MTDEEPAQIVHPFLGERQFALIERQLFFTDIDNRFDFVRQCSDLGFQTILDSLLLVADLVKDLLNEVIGDKELLCTTSTATWRAYV